MIPKKTQAGQLLKSSRLPSSEALSQPTLASGVGSSWVVAGQPPIMTRVSGILTVDGNGNGLGQDVAVGANENGDLGQRVVLEEVGLGLGGVDNDALEVDTVGLRDSENGRGAGVALRRDGELETARKNKVRVLQRLVTAVLLTSLVKTFPKDDIFAVCCLLMFWLGWGKE